MPECIILNCSTQANKTWIRQLFIESPVFTTHPSSPPTLAPHFPSEVPYGTASAHSPHNPGCRHAFPEQKQNPPDAPSYPLLFPARLQASSNCSAWNVATWLSCISSKTAVFYPTTKLPFSLNILTYQPTLCLNKRKPIHKRLEKASFYAAIILCFCLSYPLNASTIYCAFPRSMPFRNCAASTCAGLCLLNPTIVTNGFFFPITVFCPVVWADFSAPQGYVKAMFFLHYPHINDSSFLFSLRLCSWTKDRISSCENPNSDIAFI